MEFVVPPAGIVEFLEHFVSGALGLWLEARIQNASDLTKDHLGFLTNAQNKPRVWAAWRTNMGTLSACAAYEHELALRVRAHVLWIAWWITPGQHHEGSWHCYSKRPCEWIKGPGTRNN
jgi:hypothetical protein